MDFDFHLSNEVGSVGSSPLKLEHWIPLAETPELSKSERQAILYKADVVESLHIVKPGFLQHSEDGQLSYIPGNELSYYLIAAKLKRSPYMVLLGEQEKSKQMELFLDKAYAPKKGEQFYFDPYFSPGFGIIRPRFFLFERVKLDSVPNTCVLFREL